MKLRVRTIYQTYGSLLLLRMIGIPIGALLGVLDVIFGKVLLRISGIRELHLNYFHFILTSHKLVFLCLTYGFDNALFECSLNPIKYSF